MKNLYEYLLESKYETGDKFEIVKDYVMYTDDDLETLEIDDPVVSKHLKNGEFILPKGTIVELIPGDRTFGYQFNFRITFPDGDILDNIPGFGDWGFEENMKDLKKHAKIFKEKPIAREKNMDEGFNILQNEIVVEKEFKIGPFETSRCRLKDVIKLFQKHEVIDHVNILDPDENDKGGIKFELILSKGTIISGDYVSNFNHRGNMFTVIFPDGLQFSQIYELYFDDVFEESSEPYTFNISDKYKKYFKLYNCIGCERTKGKKKKLWDWIAFHW